MTAVAATLEEALAAAQRFVAEDAGFAQVTTIDPHGFPVARTMSAFLDADWSVTLVQRRSHRRLGQWRRDPATLVCWVGPAGRGASNNHPHVFDLGLLPPRMVAVRGHAEFMPDDWTVSQYEQRLRAQRDRGLTRAPVRTPAQVVADLVGVRVQPFRVRLEGFGQEAQSFTWTVPKHEEES